MPASEDGSKQLRVAVVAPPWFPIPPDGYGGIEAMVGWLVEGLVARGHQALDQPADHGLDAAVAVGWDRKPRWRDHGDAQVF